MRGAMEYVRRAYGVPARRGGRVRFQDRDEGTILSADNGRLRVRFDEEVTP